MTNSLLAQGRTDTVVPTVGTAIRGTVTGADRQNISIDVKGEARQLPVNELERIIFGSGPAGLRQAHEAMGNGQYDRALDALKKVKKTELKTQLVQQDYRFQLIYCKAILGSESGSSTAATAKELLDFLKSNPRSFHFYQAAKTLGDLAMQLGNFEKANTYYSQLAKSPWIDYKIQATVLAANALQAQGPEKYGEALKRYESVVNSKPTTPQAERQRQFALAGKATCQAELGKTDSALEIAEEIIRTTDPKDIELFAKAYNALGASYRKSDNAAAAIISYLHVDLLCHQARDAHAESLYYLSQLYPQVGKNDQATESRNTLKSRYAGTVWASR